MVTDTGYVRPTGPEAWRKPIGEKSLLLLTPDSFSAISVVEVNEKGGIKKPKTTHWMQTGDGVGNSWARGRLRPGDIVLFDQLAGDCFYRCYLLDYIINGGRGSSRLSARLVLAPFGAYAMRGHILNPFTEKNYHELMAGQVVTLDIVLPEL